MPSLNSFGAASEVRVGGRAYQIYRLSALEKTGFDLSRIPYSIKILLENLLRHEDNLTVRRSDIEYVAKWNPSAQAQEINFRPARVVLQDFTGVPAVVDLAAVVEAVWVAPTGLEERTVLVVEDLAAAGRVGNNSFSRRAGAMPSSRRTAFKPTTARV